jgi:hypothetical protein
MRDRFVLYRPKGKPSLGDPDGGRDTAPDRGGKVPIPHESLAILTAEVDDGRDKRGDLLVLATGQRLTKVLRDDVLPTPQTYRAALAAELIS